MRTEEQDQLHAEIMNIPCCPYRTDDAAFVLGYKFGHRDARHAAAELALASLPDSAGEAGPAGFLAYQTDDEKPKFFPTMAVLEAGTARWHPPVSRIEPLYTHPAPHPVGSAEPPDYLNANGKDIWRIGFNTALSLAAAPTPAVKGYHPGVSGEALSVAKKALEEIESFSGGECFEYRQIALEALAKLERLAAPSHPPATPAVAVQAEPEDDWGASPDPMDLECDVPPFGWRCTRGKGHEGPCAAVECPEDVSLVERGMDRLRADGFFEDRPTAASCEICKNEVDGASSRWCCRCLGVPAHPKPAAPATADEDTVAALMRKFQELPSWDRSYTAALETDVRSILALRSGASAQPAGGSN